jgi:hypothetical protein
MKTFTETLEPCLDCFVCGATVEKDPFLLVEGGRGRTLGDACHAILGVV